MVTTRTGAVLEPAIRRKLGPIFFRDRHAGLTGQAHRESAAPAEFALQVDSTAVQLDQTSHQASPSPVPSLAAVDVAVQLCEGSNSLCWSAAAIPIPESVY